jgi:hypothetical protein
LSSLQEELQEACAPIVDSLANFIDGPFVIGGLYTAMQLVEVMLGIVSDINEEERDDSDMPPSFIDLVLPHLKANDIDVYHGQFGDGPLEMSWLEGAIAHIKVDGIDDEVNTVHCLNFSGKGFLDNNDINATAVCIEVSHSGSSTAVFKAHPSLWEFILSGSGTEERVLKASKADVKARTLICLSFKSFELDTPLAFDDKDPTGKTIDPHSEALFKRHTKKIEKMKNWKYLPF